MGKTPWCRVVPRQKSEIFNSKFTLLKGKLMWGIFWLFHVRSTYLFSICFTKFLVTKIKFSNKNPKDLTSLYFLSIESPLKKLWSLKKKTKFQSFCIQIYEDKILIKVQFPSLFTFLYPRGPFNEIFKLSITRVFLYRRFFFAKQN